MTDTITIMMVILAVVAVGGYFAVQSSRKRGIEIQERKDEQE